MQTLGRELCQVLSGGEHVVRGGERMMRLIRLGGRLRSVRLAIDEGGERDLT